MRAASFSHASGHLKAVEGGRERLKVVHLTSVHRPDDTRIFGKECRGLVALGYDVVLVAPGAAVGTVEGVRLHSIPRASHRLVRLLTSWWHVLRAAMEERGALYHFHDPELMPVGMLLRCLGKAVVYDVHEDAPRQIRSKHWIPPPLRGLAARLVEALQWVGVRVYSGVAAAGEDVARCLGSQRVTVVRNFPLLDEFAHAEGPPYAERSAAVVHLGNLSRVRASRKLIDAFALLPSELGAELFLLGSFTDDGLEAEVRGRPGWAHTRYLGWGDRKQVAAALGRARIGVVLFGPHPNHYAVRSNKLFEYMAAGLPVVTPDFPEWKRLVETLGCGIPVDPTSPRAITDAIIRLLRDPAAARAMGRRGRAAVLAEYNWESEFRRLRQLYRRILGPAAN